MIAILCPPRRPCNSSDPDERHTAPALCLHCKNNLASSASRRMKSGDRRYATRRGLCWHCWKNKNIRVQYPPVSAWGARGHKDRPAGVGRPLPTPTDALPGTAEKIEVLRERARKGQLLAHPDDAKLPEAYATEEDREEVGEHTTDAGYLARGLEWLKLRFRPPKTYRDDRS